MASGRGLLRRRQTQTKEAGNTEVDYREVACLAYELYEQRGRIDGRDQDDWFRAEDLVRRRRGIGKS